MRCQRFGYSELCVIVDLGGFLHVLVQFQAGEKKTFRHDAQN